MKKYILNLFLIFTPILTQADNLNIKISVPARCIFGDFDVINRDIQFSKGESNIILSLQNIKYPENVFATRIFAEMNRQYTAKTKDEFLALVKQSRDYIDNLFREGENVQISIPYMKDGFYEIALCRDMAKSGKCFDKNFKNVNELLNVYKKPPADYEPPDNLYYYQLFYYDKGVITPLSGYSEDKINTFFLGNTEYIQRYSINLKTILSSPLKMEGSDLILQLPRFDRIKCGQ